MAAAARAGHDFCVGHRLQVGGPITGAPGSSIEAVAFTSDPSLPIWTESPHGSFEFYTLVGITPQELSEMQATSTANVLERLQATNPLLITDPHRGTDHR